jgi:hypothetical protein
MIEALPFRAGAGGKGFRRRRRAWRSLSTRGEARSGPPSAGPRAARRSRARRGPLHSLPAWRRSPPSQVRSRPPEYPGRQTSLRRSCGMTWTAAGQTGNPSTGRLCPQPRHADRGAAPPRCGAAPPRCGAAPPRSRTAPSSSISVKHATPNPLTAAIESLRSKVVPASPSARHCSSFLAPSFLTARNDADRPAFRTSPIWVSVRRLFGSPG